MQLGSSLKFCIFVCVHFALLQVECTRGRARERTADLYVHPKTAYITGGKVSVSCIKIVDGGVTIAGDIQWIKMTSSSVISSHPEARVRRDGHRLLFDSTNDGDEGLYCCKSPTEGLIDGCSYNSTVRISVITKTTSAPTKILNDVTSSSHTEHNIVAKSTSSGTSTWKLIASPSDRCVLLGQGATINCLNKTGRTVRFAQNIQWFKVLNVSSGRLELVSSLLEERITSDAHQLRFHSTVAKDESLYCCKAISEAKCSPTAVVNLTISLPPVLSLLQNHTVPLGETIAFNCTVTMGEPTTFLWQKHGKDLPSDPKYSIIQLKNVTTLIITNVTAVDRGYYNCIVRNGKGQQDNQSLYLQVHSPPSCSMINSSYSITIGLQAPISCSSVEDATLQTVTNKLLHSICNCSDYCITIDDINCSSDNNTIATVVVTIKEKEPLFLKDQVYTTLQDRHVKVELEDKNYTVFCVVKTLCEKTPPTPSLIPTVSTNFNNVNSAITNETNVLLPAVIITIITVMVLLILILLGVLAFILRFYKCKPKNKSSTINKSNSQTTLQITNPLSNQSISRMEAANECPSNPQAPQPMSRIDAANERPSTSSNDSGNFSLPDCNEPVSDSIDEPFSSNNIHSTENSNTHFPNSNAETNPSVSAVRPGINHSSSEHKKKKTNSASKHCRVIQTIANNGLHNIQWENNETYSLLYPQISTNTSKPPISVPKALVTADVKPHYYEDIEGMNESTRRSTRPTSNHRRTKHMQLQPTGHIRTRHPQPVHSHHSRNTTVSGMGSLPMTDNCYYSRMHVSSSQV